MIDLLPVLVPLPVLLPLLGAGIALILSKHTRMQNLVSVAILVAVMVIATIILFGVDMHGPQVVAIGGWQPPAGIVLVADRLSALMLIVSSLVTLCVLVYALSQDANDDSNETPISVFNPSYLVLCAGIANSFLAGDLFNLYVGFEMFLVASYVLLTLGATAERIRAGVTYVIISLVSSVIFLAAIGIIYAACGTVNMAQLSQRLSELPADVQMILHVMLLLGFGIKAAIFPLSFWLPDSYPTAPAPVTAVFAGLLTKVGIYAIIRTETLLFAESSLRVPLLIAAGLTMLVGILGAIAQSEIKRIVSFTLVSHIGYMLFGVALGTQCRPVRGDLLHGPPHHRPDRAVPGDRARGNARRVHLDAVPGRSHGALAGADDHLLHSRAQSLGHSSVLRIHRQGRPVPRRLRRSGVAAHRPHRRGHRDEPSHALRHRPYLQPRVLA